MISAGSTVLASLDKGLDKINAWHAGAIGAGAWLAETAAPMSIGATAASVGLLVGVMKAIQEFPKTLKALRRIWYAIRWWIGK